MIRDRINEILKWQMQVSHVEELQTAVNEAGEAEEDDPKSMPFNLDNFCTVISERIKAFKITFINYISPAQGRKYS